MSRKTFLLFLVYLSVPLALGSLELALRLWAPRLANPIARVSMHDGIEWFEVNRSFLARYFPPSSPMVPEFKPALFRKEKQPNTIRVFCLGGSTMFGTPYNMTANIPALMRKQLRRKFPDHEIEVVNFGASAINSNVVLHLSSELAAFDPDLVAIMVGHNEFYGPDGIGAGPLERLIPAAIQWKYNLRDSRLLTWLLDLIAPAFPRGSGERNLMREVSKGSEVALGSPEAERILSRFQANLAATLEVWRGRDVPVVVSEVSSSLLFHPFAYDTTHFPPPLLRLHASRSLDLTDTAGLDAALSQLVASHPANAFGRYWSGRLALLRGDTASAQSQLFRARDEDLLKFRAPGRVNEIIRAVCARSATPLVATDSLMAAFSPGGITGDRMFWEHLHPTVEGYYHIALLCAEAGQRSLRQKRGESPAPLPVIPFDVDSMSVCWLDLAYGDLSIGHLTGRWPFTHYRRSPAVLEGADSQLVGIARGTYARRIGWDEGCYASAALFWQRGEWGAAKTTYDALIEEYPFNFYPHYLAGNLLARHGDREGAMMHLERSIASNPGYPQARLDLGLLLVNAGRFDEALAQLRKAADLPLARQSPSLLSRIRYGIAAALANKGEMHDAVREAEAALSLDPGNSDARRLRNALGAGP